MGSNNVFRVEGKAVLALDSVRRPGDQEEYLIQGDDLIDYLVETNANPFGDGGFRLLSPEKYADIAVTIAHPWGDAKVPLEN